MMHVEHDHGHKHAQNALDVLPVGLIHALVGSETLLRGLFVGNTDDRKNVTLCFGSKRIGEICLQITPGAVTILVLNNSQMNRFAACDGVCQCAGETHARLITVPVFDYCGEF